VNAPTGVGKIASTMKHREAHASEERERLILEHLPQVRLIARRIHERLPESVNLDDMTSAGTLGLIAAIDRFDPAHNVKLKTYAEYKRLSTENRTVLARKIAVYGFVLLLVSILIGTHILALRSVPISWERVFVPISYREPTFEAFDGATSIPRASTGKSARARILIAIPITPVPFLVSSEAILRLAIRGCFGFA
jgi:hypothetical protein